jgi:hypothetical protein
VVAAAAKSFSARVVTVGSIAAIFFASLWHYTRRREAAAERDTLRLDEEIVT